MLGLFPPAARIYLYAKNVDMRKSFDGLLAIIQAEFQKDVRQGDLFLFLNRRLDRLKLMGWDRDGLLIVYKRLEVRTFQRPVAKPGTQHVELDTTEVAILLTGIDLASVKRRRRYTLPPVSTISAPSRIESRS
jgi:transposase